jgi:hypothetical protein
LQLKLDDVDCDAAEYKTLGLRDVIKLKDAEIHDLKQDIVN